MKYFIQLLFVLLLTTFTVSCDSITDCIINSRPHLPGKDFIDGTANVFYEESIRAEIKNEPRDNDYWYYFTVTGLPAGMDYEFIGRDLFIYGIPESPGRYSIEVFLEVEPRSVFIDDDDSWDEDGDSLCSYSTDRFYFLEVL
ncbi:hypothetical protein [Nonlabens sp.]|mgnify:CR=1 FL=1|uniref:hypothetical protein n=1 Tax=Nonlabens sp. TaxID=1888209 RepID=UPI003F69618E